MRDRLVEKAEFVVHQAPGERTGRVGGKGGGGGDGEEDEGGGGEREGEGEGEGGRKRKSERVSAFHNHSSSPVLLPLSLPGGCSWVHDYQLGNGQITVHPLTPTTPVLPPLSIPPTHPPSHRELYDEALVASMSRAALKWWCSWVYG